MTKPKLLFVQTISGFLQDESKWHGIMRLHWELGQYRDNNKCMVDYGTWKENWHTRAQYLAQLNNQTDLRVIIIGYSWGAGYGARELAEHLHSENIPIQHMVLSDPVKRSRLVSFRWLALWPKRFTWWQPSITYPPNVERLSYFTQDYRQPTGDKCKIWNGAGTVIHSKVDNTPHVAMDSDPHFYQECRDVVASEWGKL